MRTFSGYVPPVRQEDRVKVVATGQPILHDDDNSNKTRLRCRFPSWARKAGRTIRGWFTGCWGHREGHIVGAVGEPLLDGEYEESDDEAAETDRKLLCDERTESYVPRHAALSFLKTTTIRRHGSVRSRKGARGMNVVYA